MKPKFKKGDGVKIIAGKHKGSFAIIEAYFPQKNHVSKLAGSYQVKLANKMHGTNVAKVNEVELEISEGK